MGTVASMENAVCVEKRYIIPVTKRPISGIRSRRWVRVQRARTHTHAHTHTHTHTHTRAHTHAHTHTDTPMVSLGQVGHLPTCLQGRWGIYMRPGGGSPELHTLKRTQSGASNSKEPRAILSRHVASYRRRRLL